MKFFLLLLCLVGCGFGIDWDKLDDFESTFREYARAAESIISSAEGSIFAIRAKATTFIDGFSNSSVAKFSVSDRSSGGCSQTIFKYENLKTSFLNQVSRSEMPLLTHITELKEKLADINSSIRIYQDLADSKYWSCEILKHTCSEDISTWLDEVIPNIACRLTPNCRSIRKFKRGTIGQCRSFEFACQDGSCIRQQWACDGDFDCKDGSDETKGCVKRCPNGFHCTRTMRCVNNSKVCNGQDDCGDNSDEMHCGEASTERRPLKCTIEMGLYLCDGSKCIGFDQVCDDHRDCEDGSDEGDYCGKGICPEQCTRTGGVCYHGPLGPLCFAECPLGTFETPAGCTAQPHAPRSTVMELLDEIPALAARQWARFTYLKIKTIGAFSKALTEILRCQQT